MYSENKWSLYVTESFTIAIVIILLLYVTKRNNGSGNECELFKVERKDF